MNMDNPLLAAIIGAVIAGVIALISVYITSRQSLKNSSKLEEQKIIRQKREEAYLACERCRNSIASQELTLLKFVANAKHVPGNKFEPNNVHPHNQLRMLIFLYIPGLKKDMEELDKIASSFQKYYSYYAQAEIFLKYSPEEKTKFINNASSLAKGMYETIEIIKQKLIVK